MQNLLEILGKIGFDWQVALANFVNFLIILFVLKKYAFGPIKKVIQERQNKINQGLENARKAETELMMAGIKKEEIIKDAREEAMMFMIETAKNRNEIIEKAKVKAIEEAGKILAEANKNKEEEFQKMQKEIREQGIGLVLNSAEKLLKEKIDREKNEKYVKELMESFS